MIAASRGMPDLIECDREQTHSLGGPCIVRQGLAASMCGRDK